MSQLEVAKAINITTASLILIEKGKTFPSSKTLGKLSKLFQKPISFLGDFEQLPEETFGQSFKKARLYRGLSKIETGKLIGVDVKTILSWEKGLRTPINEYRGKIDLFIRVLNEKNMD